jgi:hypothetical protein
MFSLYQPEQFVRIGRSCFRQMSELHVMAKKSVNKSALVRDYLAKYPEKGPSAIAKQITAEKGVKLSGNYVATVKTKVKQAAGSAAVASPSPGSAEALSAPTPAAQTPVRKKSARKKRAKVKSAPAKPAPASASVAALSQHIANLKAAALQLGKDEAKKIIDLF